MAVGGQEGAWGSLAGSMPPSALTQDGGGFLPCWGEELVIATPPRPRADRLQGGKPRALGDLASCLARNPAQAQRLSELCRPLSWSCLLPIAGPRTFELPLGQPLWPPGMCGPDVCGLVFFPEVPPPDLSQSSVSSTSMRDSSHPGLCVFTGFPTPFSPVKAGILCVLFSAQGLAHRRCSG